MSTPSSADVIAFLNERFAARGATYRVQFLDVLPYVNPMWMANWNAPELAELGEEVEQDVSDARWEFPQVLP